MDNLIEIRTNDNEEQVVSARDLYDALDIKTPYTQWFDRMCEYGFISGIDYVLHSQKCESSNVTGFKIIQDHLIKLDMAKEIAMIQRSDKGQRVRRYFLEVEKEWNSPEKVMARALVLSNRELQTLRIDYKKLEEEVEKNKPKVLFADCVAGSRTSILVRDLAKLLKQNGIEIGQNRLYQKLREKGYIVKNSNMPTQKAMDLGLFEIKEGHYINSIGASVTTITPKVTGKGQIYFINKFVKEELDD